MDFHFIGGFQYLMAATKGESIAAKTNPTQKSLTLQARKYTLSK